MKLEPKFDALKEHCLFCNPGASGQQEQVLLRSKSFYIFAGIGAVVDGYLIIAPHRCDAGNSRFRSLSDMNPEQADELSYLTRLVIEFYQSHYDGEYTFFEHGRAGTCLIPREDTLHCYHAHLCCYPKSVRIWEGIEDLPLKPVESFHDLGTTVRSSRYLYMACGKIGEHSDDAPYGHILDAEARVALLPDEAKLQSQYLRRLYASRTGSKERWDWREYPRVFSTEALIEKFNLWLLKQTRFTTKKDADNTPRLDYSLGVKEGVREGTDRLSEHYQALWSGRQRAGDIGKFLQLLPEPREDQKLHILDAGCGPGHYARSFASMGLQVSAIDVSAQMLELSKNALADYRNSEVRELDVRDIDDDSSGFPDAHFDGIWCNAALVHIPRENIPQVLKGLNRVLKPEGILYLSTRLGNGFRTDPHGRFFFELRSDELRLFVEQGDFGIVESWMSQSELSTSGASGNKEWKHLLLRKQASNPVSGVLNADAPASMNIQHTLADVGESRLLSRIAELHTYKGKDIVLGIGDDCAALQIPSGEVLVATSDPCPTTAYELLYERDMMVSGWITAAINLSDLAGMGSRPLGMLLSVGAPSDMPVSELEAFMAGVAEASSEFECPVIGGNLATSDKFYCVGTALGTVDPARMLRRDRAEAGEHLVVLGDMGRFWVAVIARLYNLPLPAAEKSKLEMLLRRPIPRLKAGIVLAQNSLSRCAMDNSDGLTACFHQLAKSSRLDFHVDLEAVRPDPKVAMAAEVAGIDVMKLMLSWGGWELVCTIPPDRLNELNQQMAAIDVPCHVIGWVGEPTKSNGAGMVWAHSTKGTAPLQDIGNYKFSNNSYDQEGMQAHLDHLRKRSLIQDSVEKNAPHA